MKTALSWNMNLKVTFFEMLLFLWCYSIIIDTKLPATMIAIITATPMWCTHPIFPYGDEDITARECKSSDWSYMMWTCNVLLFLFFIAAADTFNAIWCFYWNFEQVHALAAIQVIEIFSSSYWLFLNRMLNMAAVLHVSKRTLTKENIFTVPNQGSTWDMSVKTYKVFVNLYF